MTNCASGNFKSFKKLPYRKILLSTGDMGFSVKNMILKYGYHLRTNIENI